jgi:hypothetical protein
MSLVNRTLRTIVLVAAVGACTSPAAAQDVPDGSQAEQSSESTLVRLAHRFLTDQEDSGVPRFSIAFGGIKPGSGIALGPAVGLNLGNGSFVQATAEYSLHDFKLLQVRYQSPKWLGKRLFLSSRVRWQDAPDIPLFPLGVDSPMAFASYGEQRTEASVTATFKPGPRWTLTAGSAYERYRTTAGRVGTEPESLPAVPEVPGLAARTTFVHAYGGVMYDTRPSPDYSLRGWMLAGAVHDYHDTNTGLFSFSGAETFGDLLLPGISSRGTFDLLGHAWTTRAADGSLVPIYLMPYLGAGDYLRGYRLYRFRARDALLLTAEHRVAVLDFLDVVGFIDAGTVSNGVRDLLGSRLEPAYGAGVLLHSPKATVFRVDLAHSSEGFQVSVSFSSGASGSF